MSETLPTFTSDWLTPKLRFWEKHLAEFRDRDGVEYLEIGSYEGRSVLWMLDHILTHETSRATCVDVWRGAKIEERFDHNIAISSHSNRLHKIKGTSRDALQWIQPPWSGPYDVIYIDGSHEARDVLSDAVLSFELLKIGGVMIFDDYGWKQADRVDLLPGIGIDAFLSAYAPCVEILEKRYQVILNRVK